MFTNTNIHDELGDDFTGATAMSNAEVKLALAKYREQAPNKKRQSETFVRAEKHTKRVAQSNAIQTNQIRSVLEQTGFSHFEKAQLANFCPPRNPARPQTADLNDVDRHENVEHYTGGARCGTAGTRPPPPSP